MTKTISATDAKLDWNAIISAAGNGDDVIVEVQGKPRTVMISFEEYQKVQEVREQHQHQRTEAVERLKALQRRQAERNKDLSEEEVHELADRFSKEFINDLVAEGKISFERDRQ